MLARRFDPVATGEGWDGFVGNEKAVETVRRLARDARETGESLVMLFYGRTGIGKSTAAQLVAREDLAVDPVDIHVTPSGRLDAEEVRSMEADFGYTTLFGSGWKVWIIEEIDKARAPEINALLTILETLPGKRVVIMTTNATECDLFGERIPEQTEKAFRGRAYTIRFTAEGLATRQGQLGPGALRVRKVAEALGINDRADRWYLQHFRSAGNSIREAINALATA